MPTKKLEIVSDVYRNEQGSKLIRVDGFFKDNTEFGLHLAMKGSDLNDFHEMLTIYEDAWRDADENVRTHMVTSYFKQLETAGRMPDSGRSYKDNFLSLLNISFLEQYGYIEGDEYNGCRYTYDEDPNRIDELLGGS